MMRTFFLLLFTNVIVVFAGAMGVNDIYREDFFDPSLLKIDTNKYLGNYIANTEILLENGKKVQLYDLFSEKPTILVLSYYTCQGSCPIRIDNLNKTIKSSDSLMDRDFNVLVLSFDKRDTLQTLAKFKKQHGPFTKHWIFGLIPEKDIETLTDSVGFKFFYSERDKVFVHTNVYIFIAPDGKITRYLFGINPKARDVRIALAEAQGDKVTPSSIVDLALLCCYTYDPSRGAFVVNPTIIFGGIGFAMTAAVVLLATFSRVASNKLIKREVQ